MSDAATTKPGRISRIGNRTFPYDVDHIYDSPMVELTQSSIATFQTCPQKYVLRYLLRLAPYGTAAPLLVGRAVHGALERLLDPSRPEPERPQAAAEYIDRVFDAVLEGDVNGLAVNQEKVDYGRAQAHAVFNAWRIINGGYGENFRVVHTELNIRSAANKPDGIAWIQRLAGKIDGLVVDRDGVTWILEHKTRFSLQDVGFLQGLELDHQVLFYAILYERWFREHRKGDLRKVPPPQGFLYDVIAKPLHRKGDTFQELVNRMVTAMVETPDKYFCFTPIEITPTMLAVARRHLERVIRQMDTLSAVEVTMRTSACNLYNGCPYRPLCKEAAAAGIDAGTPRALLSLPIISQYRIADVHEELEEET